GGLGRDELLELAAGLGSDVPFSLTGGIAIGSGRGELVTPVLAKGSYHWVFALSEVGLPTPKVYAECDRLRAVTGTRVGNPRPGSALMTALRSGDPVALGRALVNDLEPAALSLQPDLREVLEVGREFGALGALVSGSGPTVALLGADVESSIDISVALTASGVVAEVRRAIGPVHGAHVVATPART
ncbi:MAG TPA: hypothetical protein VHM65_03545, partial [Candidatus Lustribacter sp.]|nr:hypothetical protein [Candidatus Lustribacter sp.]